jgi:hypothetical protein
LFRLTRVKVLGYVITVPELAHIIVRGSSR